MCAQAMLDSYSAGGGGVAEALSAECVFGRDGINPVYIEMIVATMIAPLGVLVVFLFFWRPSFTLEKMRNRFRVVCFSVIFLLQPNAIAACFTVLTCTDVGDKTLMYVDMSISCRSSEFVKWVLFFAIPMLAFYCIIVPFGVLQHMRKYFADGVQYFEGECSPKCFSTQLYAEQTNRTVVCIII